jgi:hypothetical protein
LFYAFYRFIASVPLSDSWRRHEQTWRTVRWLPCGMAPTPAAGEKRPSAGDYKQFEREIESARNKERERKRHGNKSFIRLVHIILSSKINCFLLFFFFLLL